jgi:hypothetical protein
MRATSQYCVVSLEFHANGTASMPRYLEDFLIVPMETGTGTLSRQVRQLKGLIPALHYLGKPHKSALALSCAGQLPVLAGRSPR